MDTYGVPMFGVNGWLPNGARVYFNIPIRSPETAFEEALAFTDVLLARGFRQTEPGLNEGEHKEQIGLVGRRSKKNSDNTVSPVIDLYAAAQHLKHRYMAVYLDTPEQIQAFENASGLKLADIPVNPTKAPAERDNEELIVRVKKPLTVVYSNNPDYDETSDDKKPKRLFVRWEGQSNITPLNAPQNGAQSSGNGEKSAADRLMGNGHERPRNLVQNATDPLPVRNSGNSDGVWIYDLPALMAHPDLTKAYPQYQHRANAINLLHDGGYFANVSDLSAAVKVVLNRPDKQAEAG